MAYKGYSFKYDGTRDKIFAYICAFLSEVGWTLHDEISATVKVYKSNGESGNEPYGYVWIDGGTSTYVQIGVYQYWDAVNHVGYRQQLGGAGTTTHRLQNFSSTGDAVFYGDKNFIGIMPRAEHMDAYGLFFGHVPVRLDTNLAFAQGTAGTAATLFVSTTQGFGAGKYIQIVGAGTEGCEQLQVQSVIDAQNIIVTQLSKDYGTGSVIGAPACVFGLVNHSSYYNRFYPTSFYGDSGTTVSAAGYLNIAGISGWHSFYHHFSKKETATPIFIYADSASSPGMLMGLFGTDQIFLTCATWDVAGCNVTGEYGTAGTATTGGSALIIETGRNWTENIHTNRYVVITAGTGAGQMKKILGNDATSLTLQGTLGTAFGTSRYKIYDSVWRVNIYTPSGAAASGIRITDTTAPELPS